MKCFFIQSFSPILNWSSQNTQRQALIQLLSSSKQVEKAESMQIGNIELYAKGVSAIKQSVRCFVTRKSIPPFLIGSNIVMTILLILFAKLISEELISRTTSGLLTKSFLGPLFPVSIVLHCGKLNETL